MPESFTLHGSAPAHLTDTTDTLPHPAMQLQPYSGAAWWLGTHSGPLCAWSHVSAHSEAAHLWVPVLRESSHRQQGSITTLVSLPGVGGTCHGAQCSTTATSSSVAHRHMPRAALRVQQCPLVLGQRVSEPHPHDALQFTVGGALQALSVGLWPQCGHHGADPDPRQCHNPQQTLARGPSWVKINRANMSLSSANTWAQGPADP